MSIKLANSPCSWGVDYADAASNPHWKKVTKEIVEAGYNYSELGPYGYMPTNIEEIKLHIDSINLKIIGGFIFDNLHISKEHDSINKKIIATCGLLQKLNAEFYVIIDHLDTKRMITSGKNIIACQLDLSEYKLLVGFLKKISKICYEDFGLKPVLHPHAGTYIENELEIENIINDVNSEYMGICIDTAHLHYCGVDVCKTIQKYSNLIMHVHFKDINQDVLNIVYNNNFDFDTAVKNQVFCPLGNGVINFKKIIKLLNDINYNGYATIEQDIDPNEGLDPINYAMKSLSYLEKLGCKIL